MAGWSSHVQVLIGGKPPAEHGSKLPQSKEAVLREGRERSVDAAKCLDALALDCGDLVTALGVRGSPSGRVRARPFLYTLPRAPAF